MSKGNIYIFENPANKGILKIGKTEKHPAIRAEQLTRQTGTFGEYRLVWHKEVPDMDMAEKVVHFGLKKYHKQKEYFEIDVQKAIQLCEQIVLDFFETINKIDRAENDLKPILPKKRSTQKIESNKVFIKEKSEPDHIEKRRLAAERLNILTKALPELEGHELKLAKIRIRILSRFLSKDSMTVDAGPMPTKVDIVLINEESEPDQKGRRRLAEVQLHSIKKSLPKLEGDQLRLAKIQIRSLSGFLSKDSMTVDGGSMPSKVDKVPINEESEPDQKERRRLAELELNSIKKSLPKLEGDQLRLAKIEIRLLSKWLDHL